MHSQFVCDMSAMDVDQRARHSTLAMRLRPAVETFDELADGYAARFAYAPDTVLALAEFVTLERRCCPFLTLAVRLEREDGPLWLDISGPTGAKPFIRAEFRIP